MKIHFHGAASTVTGSMHLVEINSRRILLDCGLYQGKRKEAYERNRTFPFDPQSLDAVVLSHAHIDHSGNLPTLVKKGYRGPIYATRGTKELCSFMLLDSAHLQQRDLRFVNKRRRQKGQNEFHPLYEPKDVETCMEQLRSVRYEETVDILPGVSLSLVDAGHIMGSAGVILDVEENGRRRRLAFTGDVGRENAPIIEDPAPIPNVDLLITEGTYGNRLHPKSGDIKSELKTLCSRITRQKSRLIIPAFAVGRTQQILYFLNELYAEGDLCPVPVFVDSPMASRATEAYEAHPETYDAEALAILQSGDYPFAFPRLRFTEDVEESKKINELDGPMIIISASGMCEGGRILHHLRHSLNNPRNIVLFPGFQAAHTLGRQLIEKKSRVKIYGEEQAVRAEIISIRGLSAHADRDGLLRHVEKMGSRIQRAFVVHCEEEPGKALIAPLKERGIREVQVPRRNQAFEV